ncbi:hypothetical protein ES703_84284 [subsurface metagenome]
MYQEEDIPYYQIMDAFLEQYRAETQAMSLGLSVDIRDLEEYKARIAKTAPQILRFLEGGGVEELQTKLMIVAIASSVAKAILEARHIPH